MKAQQKIKNNEINLQPDALTDLAVPDEQAQEAKGGPDSTRPDRPIGGVITYTYTVTNTSS
ncbi:MAG TPA: hypothetical protein VKN18_04770 [Blastocatellia bacterium]|nr:hypothetical protein [Blastocatellia bacterium]